MRRPYKRFSLAQQIESMEALGQLYGSNNLDDDIELCKSQTIEPVFVKVSAEGRKILEAGAGRGQWVFYLRGLGYDGVGIDLAKSDIEFAKHYDPTVPISNGNVLHTSFSVNFFGAIISPGVIEHFEEGPQTALKEDGVFLNPAGCF